MDKIDRSFFWFVSIWLEAWVIKLFINWILAVLLIPSSITYWGGLFIAIMILNYKIVFATEES